MYMKDMKDMKDMKNILDLNKYVYFTVLTLLLLFLMFGVIDHAFATCASGQGSSPVSYSCPTVWDVQETFAGTSWLSIKIIYIISGVLGLMLVVSALMVFKQASDGGQQQSHVMKGVVRLVVAGALLSLPFISQVSQNSMLSGDISSREVIPTEADARSSSTGDVNWLPGNI